MSRRVAKTILMGGLVLVFFSGLDGSCGFGASSSTSVFSELRWTKGPAIPDREGWAGSFCGESGGAMLLVGGANFPERKPWEGGTKVWSDAVYVLENPDGAWR